MLRRSALLASLLGALSIGVAQAPPSDHGELRQAVWDALKAHVPARHPRELSATLRNELRRHAQRVAQLRRIAELAVEAGDAESQRRAAALEAREARLHEKRVERIAALPDVDEPGDRRPTEAL